MNVVINNCYGGFGISDAAVEKLIVKGWTVTKYLKSGSLENANADFVYNGREDLGFLGKYSFGKWYGNEQALRTHPDLVAVIKELEEKANTNLSQLKVITVPDDIEWKIEEYDGLECIAEVHRTWS